MDSIDRAEIIDRLYDVALDPSCYETLIDTWERRIAPLQRVAAAPADGGFGDPEIEQHLQRASRLLERFDRTLKVSGVTAALAAFGRTAAFVSADARSVLAANAAAAQIFAIGSQSRLSALPIEADDADSLRDAIQGIVSGRRLSATLIRARSPRTGGPIIFRVRPFRDRDSVFALVVTTELAWPDGLSETLREAFDLTAAEVEVVRALCEGKQVKEIARDRGRSTETVRTQLRSILFKTETHSQSELVRIALGLMDVVASAVTGRAAPLHVPGGLQRVPFESLTLADGRRYDYITFGDPDGRPLLYLPRNFGLTRWPASAEASAARRGWRVIVPVRAGYGHSSPLPDAVQDYCGCSADDLRQLLDHLGVGSVHVLSLGSDLRLAMRLAVDDPGRVAAILGCAAALPIQTQPQYERMDKWQRFILTNARHAPRVLPFLVRAGYSLARRLGKARFFAVVNAGSAADLDTFSQPEVREAMLLGSEVSLSDWHSAHEAFAQDVIDGETDWSALIRACPVPTHLIQGAQDPHMPAATIREMMACFPSLDITIVEQAGQLVFFQEWARALNALETLGARAAA